MSQANPAPNPTSRKKYALFGIPALIVGFLIAVVVFGLFNLNGRVSSLETNDAALASAVKGTEVRLDKKIQVENDVLLAKWKYIKDNDSQSDLGQKSEEEIKKLLTNGIWDIEGQIAKQYDEAVSSFVGDVSSLADAANLKAEAAEEAATKAQATADKAQKAAEIGIKAAEIVAKPTKPLHHAVTKEDKSALRELIAEWRRNNP